MYVFLKKKSLLYESQQCVTNIKNNINFTVLIIHYNIKWEIFLKNLLEAELI